MPYNFVADSLHTKKLLQISSSKVRDFRGKKCRFAFFEQTFMSKCTSVKLTLLIELFRWVLRLSPYERKEIENWRFRSNVVSLIQNYR